MLPVQTERKLTGKDFITIGIFSAIYFIINFAFMLAGGIHPVMWILMPGWIALFTGIPYLLMAAKVQKPGAVLLMGVITGLIYFATGQFTALILVFFAAGCGLAELTQYISRYNSTQGNLLSFIFFSLGMIGSPIAIWVFKESFLIQIAEQGMPPDYVAALQALTSETMLIVLLLAPIFGAVIGGIFARGMFRKHFAKAGIA